MHIAQLTKKDHTQPKGREKIIDTPENCPTPIFNKITVRPLNSSLPALQRFVLRFNLKKSKVMT